VIVEGFMRSSLANGHSQVIHGMMTSGGCPPTSTLNDIDGVGKVGVESVAEKHFKNADGVWTPVLAPLSHEYRYDEQAKLNAPPIERLPYFVETMDGRTFSGRAGPDGLLPRIDTYGEDEYTVYWGDEALARTIEVGV
jgi:hypothetical protein